MLPFNKYETMEQAEKKKIERERERQKTVYCAVIEKRPIRGRDGISYIINDRK